MPAWQRRGSSPSYRLSLSHKTPSPSQQPYSKYSRRWRWWDILFMLVVLLGLVQFFGVLWGNTLLSQKRSSIRIALKQYPILRYRHLNEDAPAATLTQGTSVYHVTKEFGVASMGGMGMVVTAMAAAQQRSGKTNVAIVMPFYSYIKKKAQVEKVIDLSINVRDAEGRLTSVDFRVSKMIHYFTPPGEPENVTSWEMVDGINTTMTTTLPAKPVPFTEQVPVYLIGPGNLRPFNAAFRASKAQNIYSTPKVLPQEWKDQYFNKAAAEFLAHRSSAVDEVSLFAPARTARRHVDVIHVHGATNAYTIKHIRDFQQRNQLGARPPAILYTMHDYLDELQYTILWNNVKKFLDEPDLQLARYTLAQKTFMSGLGIDYADAVTFVSRRMAVDIIEGRDEFYLKELVMDNILRKAEQGRFFGITNGVDYTHLDPFSNSMMTKRKIAFPSYALDLIREAQHAQQPEDPLVWKLSRSSKKYVSLMKSRAKEYLVRRKILTPQDTRRPMVLFVGRFQYNKGLEMFDEAVHYFAQHDMKFVIIGQPNNYPLKWVKALEERYPDHVIVMYKESQQRKWLTLCRAAADFVFVPSLTESFGLVAAEGLLFGSPVISTGAGGLKEFLVDRPPRGPEGTLAAREVRVSRDLMTNAPVVTSSEKFNAYLFTPDTLHMAIRDAAEDYTINNSSNVRREEFVLRMIKSSYDLGWDRGHEQGPLHDYMKVYELALNDRPIPPMSKHELVEEHALLRRLQI
ncbi:hypothetical protein BX666DRAFT_1850698 [Dichotomocladium elegans]|nr:hypothetical protein BX666DRAFT_1850698 [Dichotomocladium elegans]